MNTLHHHVCFQKIPQCHFILIILEIFLTLSIPSRVKSKAVMLVMLVKLSWMTEKTPTLSHKNCSLRSTSSDCLTSPAVIRCARLLSYISRSHVMLSYVSKHCSSSQASHRTDHTEAVSQQKFESCAVLKRKQLPDQEKVKVICICGGGEIYSDTFYAKNKQQDKT